MNIVRMAVIALFLHSPTLSAQVTIEGGYTDCGEWAAARKANRGSNLEHFVLGFVNGMSIATNVEFWRVGGMNTSREAVFLWMDNYCNKNPLDTIPTGVHRLFSERSGWRFKE